MDAFDFSKLNRPANSNNRSVARELIFQLDRDLQEIYGHAPLALYENPPNFYNMHPKKLTAFAQYMRTEMIMQEILFKLELDRAKPNLSVVRN